MKAIALENFGGVEHFRLADLPDPQAKEGEVRIRICCAAFNPVDYKMRQGRYSANLPLILGADCSGIIDQVGSQVKGFAVGDEVVAMLFGQASNGSYAELACVPSFFVAKKPSRLSFAEGASFPLVSLTAYRALISSRMLQRGNSFFIVGAGGGVGSLVVEMANYLGATEIFTLSRDEKSRQFLTEKLGLKKENIILYEGLNEEQLKKRILESNQGRLFDVTCDLVGGNRKALCLELTAYSGGFTTIVPEEQGFELSAWVKESLTFAKNLTVHFTFVGTESFTPSRENWKIYQEQLHHIIEWIEQKILNVPLVTLVGDLGVDTVKKAHFLLEEGKVKGKLIMNIIS